MNRLVSVNLEGVASDRLPPAAPGDRVRVLFLTATFLGFGTYHRFLLDYADRRDDLDAVHVELQAPTWLRVLGKSVRGLQGWDQHHLRHTLGWRRILRGWLRTQLPPDRFDVVHVVTEVNAAVATDFAGRAPAFAVNIDATVPQLVREYGYPPLAMRPLERLQRRIFDAADLVVGRNRWCLESVRDDFRLPESRIHLARNSMRPVGRSRADDPPRPADQPLRMVFVGNAWMRKGGPEVLRLHQERWADRIEFHVCSKGAPRDESARNVVWHGRMPREELLGELLPSMDLFVMPTRQDMHPWAILEALSTGLPVVSTRMAGIPEMVIDGETGRLHPPGDREAFAAAVEALEADRAACHRMGRQARAHVERNYDPDATFDGLMDRLAALGRGARERSPR